MMMLLDSTVLIDVLRRRSVRRVALLELVQEGYQLATTAIHIGEIYAGVRDEERPAAEELLGGLLIAATAIHHNCSLMTDNIKDFPMEGLVLFPVSTTTE